MHICIPLYIHITVLYYILGSFQKINVNVNVKRTLKKIKSKHSIKKKNRFQSLYSFLPAQLQQLYQPELKKD